MPSGNITLSEKSPKEGDKVTISVNIRNMGSGPSAKTTVIFYVDNRSLGEVPVPVTQKNNQVLVSIIWKAKAGLHTIRVRVNPNETLVEMNYDNNVLQTTFDVQAKGTSFSPALILVVFIIIAVVVAGVAYAMRPKGSGQKPKKRRPAPVEEEETEEEEPEEEETEEEEPEEELPDIDEEEYQGTQDEEEVHEAEVVEQRPVKPKKVITKPKKNVARPMTFAENYKAEEHEDVDLDKDDMGGVIRFR